MESEEPEIKSKQASKRDRTLKSRLTIQFFPPQNTRNRLRKRRAQTSNLQVLSQSNSNINKSTKIVTKIVSPKNGHNNGSPNSRTTQIPEVSTLVTKQEIAQEKSSGLHQEAITPVVNQLTLWHYRFLSFKSRDTNLERFLPKNQHTQRVLLIFENWCN